jgi:hypothetical protein
MIRIDLNHRYNESDIVSSEKLTSLGMMLKQIAIDNRDWQKAAPGPSQYQSVGYRIKTNAQTIIINMDYNDTRKDYYNCYIINNNFSNEIKTNWLMNKLLPKSFFLKKKFNEYKVNESYDLSYVMDGKKYLFTGGLGSWVDSGSLYKKCINTETNKIVFLYADIGSNFDGPRARWETKEEEYLENL